MPAKRPAKPPRVRLLVDERRAQLLQLGLTLFSQRSYDEVSVDELARAAGISKGLLYHYYPTKRDLYVAALRHASQRLLDETAPDPADSPDDQVRRGLETYLDFVERHGAAYTALIRGGIGSDREVTAILEATRGALAARIADNLPPVARTTRLHIALRGWIGFVEAAVLEWRERRGMARRALVELLATALFDIATRAHATAE